MKLKTGWKKKRIKVSIWLQLLAIALVFALFISIAAYYSIPDQQINYEALADNFVLKVTNYREEKAVDQSNFNRDPDPGYVPRLPHYVYINPNRIAVKTEKKTTSKKNSSSNKNSESGTGSYSPGTYTMSYDMNVRTTPSTSGQVVSQVKKGSSITFISVRKNDDGEIWGETSSGDWVCIKDGTMIYAR